MGEFFGKLILLLIGLWIIRLGIRAIQEKAVTFGPFIGPTTTCKGIWAILVGIVTIIGGTLLSYGAIAALLYP